MDLLTPLLDTVDTLTSWLVPAVALAVAVALVWRLWTE